MSNNDIEDNDDFDDDEVGFDGFDEKEGTLGALIRDNPLAKVGVIFAAAAFILGIIIFFGGGDQQDAAFSLQTQGSTVSGIPGTDELSPTMVEAITEVNDQQREAAIREGTSAIPIPIDPPSSVLTQTPQDQEQEDPLQRWRRLQQERLERELQSREVIQPADSQDNAQRQDAINRLAEIMSAQMAGILGEIVDAPPLRVQQVTDREFFRRLEEFQNEGLIEEIVGEDLDGDGEIDTVPLEIVLPAGEISYAQLLVEANSDVPGPVLAQIVSGPLSGNRILGSFTKTENNLLILNFNTIVIDGLSYPISGVAIDPDTTLTAMATDVDNRYLRRIFVPAAAAFIEGAAEAIAESGRTTISVEGDTVAEETEETDTEQEIASGIEEAAAEVREILDEFADVEALVIIKAGTPMGILFTEPVTQPITDEDDI